MHKSSAVLALLSTLALLACSGGDSPSGTTPQPSAGQNAGGTPGGQGGAGGTSGSAGAAGGQAGTGGTGGTSGGTSGAGGAGDPCDESCALQAKACSKPAIPGCKNACLADWFPNEQTDDCKLAAAGYLSCLNSQEPNWTCDAGIPSFVGPQGPNSFCASSFFLWANCLPPTAVNVLVKTVYFAPAKVDGSAWDSTAKIPKEIVQGIATALAGPAPAKAAAETLDLLQDIAIDKVAKPDPIIYATILNKGLTEAGGWIVPPNANEEDNYAPQFVDTGVSQFPFDPSYSIQLKIDDEDLSNNDSAGAPIITYQDISSALKLGGKTYFVKTNEESVGQVLFVGIAVFPVN